MTADYENITRKIYDCGGEGDLYFIPVCPQCGRFVKADERVTVNGLGNWVEQPNATCKKCGRVEMPFEGFV